MRGVESFVGIVFRERVINLIEELPKLRAGVCFGCKCKVEVEVAAHPLLSVILQC